MGLKVDLSSLIEARRARSRSDLDRLRRYWKIGLRIGSRRIRYPPLGVGIGMVPREGWADFAGIGTRAMLEAEPILNQTVYSSMVLMALMTTIITVRSPSSFRD